MLLGNTIFYDKSSFEGITLKNEFLVFYRNEDLVMPFVVIFFTEWLGAHRFSPFLGSELSRAGSFLFILALCFDILCLVLYDGSQDAREKQHGHVARKA